jgi:hypothetical protein
MFGLIALTQGLRYHPSQVPYVEQPPTRDEDLSTKPSCQQSYVDNWATIIAPQPWIETHLKFYYQMQAEVGAQITWVLDALRETEAYENTIVIFSSRRRSAPPNRPRPRSQSSSPPTMRSARAARERAARSGALPRA